MPKSKQAKVKREITDLKTKVGVISTIKFDGICVLLEYIYQNAFISHAKFDGNLYRSQKLTKADFLKYQTEPDVDRLFQSQLEYELWETAIE